jgi:SNF2 family DNA or RNA helicase
MLDETETSDNSPKPKEQQKYKTELLDEEEEERHKENKKPSGANNTKAAPTNWIHSFQVKSPPKQQDSTMKTTKKNVNSNNTSNSTTISQYFKPKEGNSTGKERSAVLKHLLSDDFKEDSDFQVDNSPLKKFKLPSHVDMEGAEPLILSQEPLVKVPASINKKLRDYQREGVKFLYNLYKEGKGGILAGLY